MDRQIHSLKICDLEMLDIQVVCSSYDKYHDNLTKMYFSVHWLVKADLQNWDGIGDFQVKLGQPRLNRDGWTLCKVFRGGPAACYNVPWKFANCWKCIEIVNPTITMLFCIILNLTGGPFWLLGVCVHAMHPPAYRPDV